VVADQKRAGFFREVVAAQNPDPVNGMREKEKDETAEPLRQEEKDVDGSGGGDHGGREDDSARIEVNEFREEEVCAGGDCDSDKREQVGGRDDTALVLFGGAMLDERVYGNCEEAGPEAQSGKEYCGSNEADVHSAEGDGGQGHADGTERDEAVFNLVAADEAGNHTADADANSERGIQVTSFGLADVQDVGAIYDDGREKKGTEEPEVGVAENGEEERLVLAHELDLLPEIADKVCAEFFLRRGWWHAVDAEAGAESRTGEREKSIASIDFVAGKLFGHGGAGNGSGDDGEEGSKFDDPITEREALGRKEFGKQPILRRTEECSLGSDKAQRNERKVAHMKAESGGGDGHSADLHDLGPDGDLAFAEVVGEPAAGHAEEDEGHGEKECDYGDEGVAFVFAQAHADDHCQQEVTKDVVAECALKLSGDQGPEAALAARSVRCDGDGKSFGIC